MDMLQRISAQSLRGGLRLCRYTESGCAPEVIAPSRDGGVCRMSGGGEGCGPIRYRPRESTKVAKEVIRDDSRKTALQDTGKYDDSELRMPADKSGKQAERGPGTINSRYGRRSEQRLPFSEKAVKTNKYCVNQEQVVALNRNEALLLQLTYANGRKVETTFEDGKSIFNVNNDEVKTVSDLAEDLVDHSAVENLDNVRSEMLLVESKNDEAAAAKRYALSLLAAAPQPVSNLRKKLSGKNISELVIERTIKDLQSCGLQSDREYAELFARSRWRSFTWGPLRIKLELQRRGLSQDDIEIATKRVFETTDFEGSAADEDADLNEWGMTAHAKQRLLQQVSRQWQKGGPGLTDEARQRRMVGWLQRRGFKWSIVVDVLKSVGCQQKYHHNILQED